MQTTFSNGTFTPALEAVTRIAASQASILEHVLVSANGCLRLAAMNRIIAVDYQIDAQVEAEGAIAVPARTLLDVVKSFPANETLSLRVLDDFRLQVCCGRHRATVKGMDAEGFPSLPAISGSSSVQLDAETLATAIYQVASAAAPANSPERPTLQGVLLQVEGNTLTLVAADGYQMAIRKVSLDDPVVLGVTIVIPASAMRDVANICRSKGGAVTISTDHNHVVFQLEGVTLVSQLISGSYPDYTRVIPPDDGIVRIGVAAADLAGAVRTACIFAESDPTHCINLVARQALPGGEAAGLVVSGCSLYTGDAAIYVTAQVEAAEAKPSGVNLAYKFIKDAANASSGSVQLGLRGPGGKVSLTSDDGNLLRLIMPIHVIAEEGHA